MNICTRLFLLVPFLVLPAAAPAVMIGNTLVEFNTRPPANVNMITVTASLNADLDGIIFRSMGVQAIFSGPGYHDSTNWKFASPREYAVIGWNESYPPEPGPHNAVGTHRQMTFAGISHVWYSSDRVIVPPGFCEDLAPTHVVRIPFAAAATVQVAPVSGRQQAPSMWLHHRDEDLVTNRLAAIRAAGDSLNIYYRPHDANGRSMPELPGVTLPGIAAVLPQYPARPTHGVAELDLWEDGEIHSVRLWLPGGETLMDGDLTAAIRRRALVTYPSGSMRHRVIMFHPFSRTQGGGIDFESAAFAYQPLCCAGPIAPCGPRPGRFCP